MSEYLDYDEAVRANRARKKKAMAMKRKRQAQIRLIKRNLFAAILLLVISVVVTKSVKAISSHADDGNAQQQAVLTDNVIEDNNITVIQQESVFKCAAKSPDYKEMLDGDIQSPYVALLDVTNNQLIAGKQADTRIYPASMTKVMSLIIAVENIQDLNKTYRFGFEELNNLYIQQASVAGFSVDEEVTANDLLYGLALPSGADAAYGIAQITAGSEEEFVKLMNEKCEEMGLKNTHFCNPSGLHDVNQYTTASTPQHPEGIHLTSTMFSRMVGNEVPGVTIKAGKTGYTDEAHNCLVNFAEKDGKEYVTVMAAAGNRWYVIFDGFKIYERYLP